VIFSGFGADVAATFPAGWLATGDGLSGLFCGLAGATDAAACCEAAESVFAAG